MSLKLSVKELDVAQFQNQTLSLVLKKKKQAYCTYWVKSNLHVSLTYFILDATFAASKTCVPRESKMQRKKSHSSSFSRQNRGHWPFDIRWSRPISTIFFLSFYWSCKCKIMCYVYYVWQNKFRRDLLININTTLFMQTRA